MEVKLFASDFIDAKSDIEVDAELFFEIPSADWLNEDENKPKLTRLLSEHFGELGELSTKSEEMTTFCIIPFKTSVAVGSEPDGIFELSRVATDSGIDLVCGIGSDAFNNFNDSVKEQYMSSIKLKDMELRISLNNDTQGSIDVTGYSVYLDKKPVAFEGKVSLAHRKDLEITVSAVHLAAMHKGAVSRVLTITK